MALTGKELAYYTWHHEAQRGGYLHEYEQAAFFAGWNAHREWILNQAGR